MFKVVELESYHTVNTLAERWQCSDTHVRNLCNQRHLSHIRIGSRIRIPQKYVDEFEQERLSK